MQRPPWHRILLVPSASSARLLSRRSLIYVTSRGLSAATSPSDEVLPQWPAHRGPIFYFETGHGFFAKRPPRPFPPPFGAASPPPSTDGGGNCNAPPASQQQLINGARIRGCSNGDDAVLEAEQYLGVNDGVGAWSTRPNGHAA